MTTLTAAPVVRKHLCTMPSPGYTDFTRIYIASELNASEYRTALRHEQAHVWSRHNMRRPESAQEREWEIACEMEIARSIYDALDIATINAPRSRLRGGYLPDTIADLPPGLLLAEDIYQWLLHHPQEEAVENMCSCSCAGEAQGEGEPAVPAHDIRRHLDEMEAVQASAEAAASAYRSIMLRTPSLTEAIDASLRVRIVRESSYARPSRRQIAGIILRGRKTTPRPPRVEIFVDRSGSFTPQKTSAAEDKLRLILARYGGCIQHDVWYFGNGSIRADGAESGGDTPYALVAQHLLLSQPKIAVIITDDDACPDLPKMPPHTQIFCVAIGSNATCVAAKIGATAVIA